MPQFLVHPEDVDRDAARAVLRREEAHHLLRVLRARNGQAVRVFDGRGNRWQGLLRSRSVTEAHIEELQPIPGNEPVVRLELIQSLPKSETWEWVLEKGTELGVSRFQPVYSEHGVATIPPSRLTAKKTRWQARLLAASKQCERAVVPQILDPLPLTEYLKGLGACKPDETRLYLAEPARAAHGGTAVRSPAGPRHLRVAVGPEGGWGEHDTAVLLSGGFRALNLGPRVLRSETAAVAGVAVLLGLWGELESSG